jgi:hypothetical protein
VCTRRAGTPLRHFKGKCHSRPCPFTPTSRIDTRARRRDAIVITFARASGLARLQ